MGTTLPTIEYRKTTAPPGAEGSVIEQLANELVAEYMAEQRQEGRMQ